LSTKHSVHGKINAFQLKGFDFLAEEREVSFVEKATQAEMGMVAQFINQIFSFDDLIGD